MRTTNEWTLASLGDLNSLVNQSSVSDVADSLGVSENTVSRWMSGARAPNRRYQLAIASQVRDFKNMSASQVGEKLNAFLTINGLDADFLAERLSVSENTVQAYLDGDRRPRAIRKVQALLSTPTPA